MTRLVVTGTDTDVGKTVFAAALAGALDASYWKPVQAGLDGGSDASRVAALSGLARERILPEAYRLMTPCSPDRAATIDGVTHPMPDPFLVIATQNPIEYEGTFALPEAQLDRFMLRIRLGYPQPIEEIVILDEQKRSHPLEELEEVLAADDLRALQSAVREIYVDSTVSDYIVRVVGATRNHPDVYLGASPRGSIALYRAGQALAGLLGRDYVIPDETILIENPIAVPTGSADQQEARMKASEAESSSSGR